MFEEQYHQSGTTGSYQHHSITSQSCISGSFLHQTEKATEEGSFSGYKPK